MRAESRVVEVEKQCSMLEFDLKQSVQKMEQLMKQKERLEDEVSKRLLPAFLYNEKYQIKMPFSHGLVSRDVPPLCCCPR